MTRLHGFLGAVALIAILGLPTGCGGTVIDSAKTEDALEQNLASSLGKKVKSVDCPSDVEVEPKATFTCTIVLVGGEEQVATLRIENEDADVSVTDLRPADKAPSGQ